MKHHLFSLIVFLSALFISCQPLVIETREETENKTETLTLTTREAESVTSESALLSASVYTDGDSKKIIAYFYYGEQASTLGKAGSQKSEDVVLDNPGGFFSATVSGLKGSTKYYFAPASLVGNSETIGSIGEFTTLAESVKPSHLEAVTEEATGVSYNEATLKVSFKNNSPKTIQSTVGILLGTQSDLASLTASGQDYHATKTASTGFVSHTFNGLVDGTTYYFVGYITVEDVTVYGDIEKFTTPGKSQVMLYDATEIGIRTAKLTAAYINKTSVQTVTFGISYSKTETTPSGLFNKGEKAETQLTYESRQLALTCQRLDAQSTYYYAAYLIAGGETFYSEVKSFTTDNAINNVIEYTTTDGALASLHGSLGAYVGGDDNPVLGDVRLVSHTVSGGVCRAVFDNPIECMYGTFYEETTVKTAKVPEGANMLYFTFNGCSSLESVEIPSSVIHIWTAAFQNCTSLTEVTIPENVETIGDNAFFGCSNLKTITLRPTVPPLLGSLRFPLGGVVEAFYVPAASLEAYKTADIWSSYAEKMIAY